LIPINKAYISVSVRGVNSYHEDKKVDYSVVASEVGIGRDGTVESVKGLAVNKRFDNGDGVAMHVALRSHLLDRCPADMSFLRIKATVKGFGDEVRYKQIFDLLGDTKTMQVAFNMSDAAITRFTAITTIAEKLLQPRYLHPDYPKVLLDVETWIPLGEGGSVPSAMDPLREGFLIAVGTREKDSDFGKLALRGWRDWRINNGTLEYRDESDATEWHSAEKYTYVIYAVTSETSRREDVRSAWFGKYSE
ncbi:MAG: hypothetical protein GTN78_15455, partial [Gemmatimonadales bacterium]|nr:hypothetical protein [Gemmatimonadales bacterium]